VAVVLLDAFLSNGSSMGLLDDLVVMLPRVVTIMVTGHDDVALAVEAMRRGARDFLIKPVTQDTLGTSMARVLSWQRRALEAPASSWPQAAVSDPEALDRLQGALRQFSRAQGLSQALLRSLCHLAEFRDPETGAHLDRVAGFSMLLARDLVLRRVEGADRTDAFAEAVFDAAPLHDIGKVGIRDAILLKPGPLDPEEFEEMKRHTVIAEQVLGRVVELARGEDDLCFRLAREIAMGHHERVDGQGYPLGRRAKEIPLAARIVAVADFYDACTSQRPYRNGVMSQEQVCALVQERAGSHFDPEVARAFAGLAHGFQRISETLTDGARLSMEEMRRVVEHQWRMTGR
jgi:putative two-component system response regulator